MDWIEKVLEKVREWIDGLVDALLGDNPQPQPIPIPVRERSPYRFHAC